MILNGLWIWLLQVDYANVTRLNYTKSMPVVNGQYPGPKLHVHEGDSLIVTVTNLIPHPVTIHWLVFFFFSPHATFLLFAESVIHENHIVVVISSRFST